MIKNNQDSILKKILTAKKSNVKKLELKYCDFQDGLLPPELFELTQLEYLVLSYNNLRNLPEELSLLINLKFLELVSDHWEEFPKVICKLINLEVLVMGGIDASGQGADYYVGYGNHVFSYPNIRNIPIEIRALQNLQILDLVTCRIKEIPEELTELPNLETLKLDYNLIEFLPLGLCRMSKLKVLTISNNPVINNIPKEILRVSGEFTKAGTYIQRAVQNNISDYVENRHSTLSEKTINKGLEDLLNYLKEIKKESLKISSAKVMVLGNECVGKTSIIYRMINDSFQEIPIEKRTHGVVISNWLVDYTQVNIWDFGGQEIYHGTHQVFLSDNLLYVIVLDELSNEQTVAYWLDFIGRKPSKSRVIIVQNKTDRGFAKLDNISALYKNFNFEKTIHYISTKCGNGFSAFKKAVEEAIKDISIENILPKSWQDLSIYFQSQVSHGKKLLPYNDFVDKCKLELIDISSAHTILKYWHERGNIFFQNELFDKHIILNQQWVIDKIYKVLANTSLEYVNKGIIKLKDVCNIWTEHTEDECKLFLSFMVSCEICFTEQCNNSYNYIIPRLLPKKEAFVEDLWDNERNVSLIMQHIFLHPRTMERFLVKVGRLANRQYWKNCVFISDPDKKASAIIESFYKEAKILVRVKGDGKYVLLDEIRALFEEIETHRDVYEYVSLDGDQYVNLKVLKEKFANNHSKIESVKGTELPVKYFIHFIKHPRKIMQPLKIFVSYCHKDKKYKDRLLTGLSVPIKEGKITVWQDADILPGQELSKEILSEIYVCNIICLLISPDFIASDFCFSTEMKIALERHEKAEIHVIPIIVRDTPGWHNLEIGRIKALPKDGKPVSNWTNKDKAWSNVVSEMVRLINSINNN